MPPILLAVFHCSLYRERISSWGAAGLFQFPLLREGRLVHFNFIRAIYNFNSRPSARGDPVNVERKSFTPSHFNSRPSVWGDVRVLVAAIIGAISIHAPPRGATCPYP